MGRRTVNFLSFEVFRLVAVIPFERRQEDWKLQFPGMQPEAKF